MRERQLLVDPGAARQAARVQLARRQHDLAVLAVDDVAVVVDRRRSRSRCGSPGSARTCRAAADRSRAARSRSSRRCARGPPRETSRRPRAAAPRPGRARTPSRVAVMLLHDERRLAHLLVRPDDEALDDARVDAAADGDDDIERDGPDDGPAGAGAKACQTASAAPASAATASRRRPACARGRRRTRRRRRRPTASVRSCGICSHAPNARTTRRTAASSDEMPAAPGGDDARAADRAPGCPPATCEPATPDDRQNHGRQERCRARARAAAAGTSRSRCRGRGRDRSCRRGWRGWRRATSPRTRPSRGR